MATRAEIMAAGVPAAFARMIGSHSPVTVNAGGNSQDTAPELPINFAQVMVTAGGQGVRLKPAIGQYLNVIYNAPGSVASCNLWPADGEDICFQGPNQALSLSPGVAAILVPAAKHWNGGGLSGSGAVSGGGIDTVAAYTAAGTTQATATPITTQFANFTTVAAGSGAALPAGAAGAHCRVRNSGANALILYPRYGDHAAINAQAADAPVVVPVNVTAYLEAFSVTQWFTVP